jgi:hypothetical protein
MAGYQFRHFLISLLSKRDENESATPLGHAKVGGIYDVEPDTISHPAQPPEQERETAVITKSRDVLHHQGSGSQHLHEVCDAKYEPVSRIFLFASLLAERRESLARHAGGENVQASRLEIEFREKTVWV